MMFIAKVMGISRDSIQCGIFQYTHETIVILADSWKDFQVANVSLRIQNIPEIHLIHCYQGKHNPIQRWLLLADTCSFRSAAYLEILGK